MGTIRIAMCQTVCLDGDRTGNLARAAQAVEEAARRGAKIACLPEMAVLGWVNPTAHKRAHPIPGKDSERLCALAKKHGIFLTVGLAEKDGECLYDTVLLIDDGGQILQKHRKINLLTELMTPPYTPGKDVKAVETALGRIGVLICADTHAADILTSMAELGPKLVIVPYGYAAGEDKWPRHGKALESVVVYTAKAVHAPVVGTNLIGQITHGPWRGQTYGGHSVTSDKTGRILALGKDFDRDVKIVEVTLD